MSMLSGNHDWNMDGNIIGVLIVLNPCPAVRTLSVSFLSQPEQ